MLHCCLNYIFITVPNCGTGTLKHSFSFYTFVQYFFTVLEFHIGNFGYPALACIEALNFALCSLLCFRLSHFT